MKTIQKPHLFSVLLALILLFPAISWGQSLQPFLPTSNPQGNIELPTVMGNKLFFVCTSTTTGKELWVTDGTPDGCQLVKDIFTSTGGSNPHDLMVVGNVLFFWANDGVNGDKLWMTDGTETGTKFINDQSPTGYATTTSKRIVGGRLIISATAGTGQRFLFSVDQLGTVTKLSPVAQGTSGLVDFNNRLLLFQNNDSLFVFNEAFSTKTLIKTGVRMYFPSNEPIGCILGNKYVFTGSQGNSNYEPWVTDGTPAGTMMLSDIAPTSSFTSAYYAFNGKAYFTVNSGPVGSELYATDGTVAGTYLVKNINLQNNGVTGSNPNSFTAVGDSLYFLADDGFFGRELYVTTGTEQSTRRLTDLRLGTASGNISNMTAFQGRLYFRISYDSLVERKNGILTKFRYQNATGSGNLAVVGNVLLLPINYGLGRIFPDLSIGQYTNNSVNSTNSYFSFANRIFGIHTSFKMFSILESDLVSVVPEIEAPRLSLYPNPVHDRLNFRTDPSFSPKEYVITNVLGKKHNTPSPLETGQSVDVSALSPGIYWIRLIGANSAQMVKFVKN